MTDVRRRRPVILGAWLVLAGLVGLLAAFSLTLDKFRLLEDPDAQLGCNISPLVGCGTNLVAWQGAVFGFPNPLIGLAAWTAVLVVGVGILTGVRFPRVFWLLFDVGVVGGLAFVIWLITQSLFSLDTLCPWCMVTWTVMIPTFWAVTLYNLSSGTVRMPAGGRRLARLGYTWVPTLTLVSYAVVAIVAQVQLDWLHTAL